MLKMLFEWDLEGAERVQSKDDWEGKGGPATICEGWGCLQCLLSSSFLNK